MLKSLFAKPRNQSGDTIVEVLISVAICGFVLGGSYYVINHQLAQIENQQEHNQAAKLVESQVEDIKAYIVTGSLANVVCFYYDGSSLVTASLIIVALWPQLVQNRPILSESNQMFRNLLRLIQSALSGRASMAVMPKLICLTGRHENIHQQNG
jgi:Na+-transporting NADH:ubiquinone oxidoreductase subunit NqrC